MNDLREQTYPRCRRNWVTIAVANVGGIHPAARICRVRPTTLKRWYWRGWVELVEPALRLAEASGLSVIRLIGFGDMPSLGRRQRLVVRAFHPRRRLPEHRTLVAQRLPGFQAHRVRV